MSEMTTIARPYAKAIFEHAVEHATLALWTDTLYVLAEAMLNAQARNFIDNPKSTLDMQCSLLLSLFKKSSIDSEYNALENLLKLLARNKKLRLLPDIYAQFQDLRAQQEKTLHAHVRSYSPLNKAQEQRLIDALSKRLKRKITLNIEVDESLLGGAIIQAGDLVIDGSVRGKLNKLRSNLAA